MSAENFRHLQNEIKAGLTSSCAVFLFLEMIYKAKARNELTEEEYRLLVEQFRASLVRSEMRKLMEKKISYAIRLSLYPGELIYEEMHKLFSLTEEISLISEIGLGEDSRNYKDYVFAIRQKVRMEI